MTERAGIEIDYCPQCRGVWLDRGELDKLIQGESEYQRRGNSSQNQADFGGDGDTGFLDTVFDIFGNN